MLFTCAVFGMRERAGKRAKPSPVFVKERLWPSSENDRQEGAKEEQIAPTEHYPLPHESYCHREERLTIQTSLDMAEPHIPHTVVFDSIEYPLCCLWSQCIRCSEAQCCACCGCSCVDLHGGDWLRGEFTLDQSTWLFCSKHRTNLPQTSVWVSIRSYSRDTCWCNHI